MTLFAVALSAEIRGGKDCLSVQLFHSETEQEAKKEMREFVFRDLYHQGVEAEDIHVRHIESIFITAGDGRIMDLYNHKTQDGLTPIIMLEDTHLLNIIRFHLRQIENARLVLEQKDKPVPTVQSALYRNQPQADPSQIITKAHETLMPYVLEALLRGLTDDFVLQMQTAYGYAQPQKTIEAKSELGF